VIDPHGLGGGATGDAGLRSRNSIPQAVGFAVCLTLSLAGCAALPGSGPAMMPVRTERTSEFPFQIVDLTPDTIHAYAVVPRRDTPSRWASAPTQRVSLRSGDVLKVVISEAKDGGLFAPLSVGGTLFPAVRVDHRGMISLPHAGQIAVAGLDTIGVEERIRDAVVGKAYEPQVYVELVADRSHTVAISGDVKAGGRFSLLEGPMTVIDAVNRAGGTNLAPYHLDVVVRRNGRVYRTGYARVLSGENPPLVRGDEVILEPNVKRFIALGAVTRAGQYDFVSRDQTLLDSLGQIGGLTDQQADRTGVFIFRMKNGAPPSKGLETNPDAVLFRLDLTNPDSIFLARQFAIHPDDAIYVTNAPLYEWKKIIIPAAQAIGALRGISSIPE
jgi:polysaccharide export outer membrane protein